MCNHDGYGITDDQFLDAEFVYRRIDGDFEGNDFPDAHWPSSQWRDGLSCDWSAIVTERESRRNVTGRLLVISIRECRRLGIRVHYDPITDPASPDYNLAHCLLCAPPSVLQSKTRLRQLRDDLKGAGCEVKYINCDVALPSQPEESPDTTQQQAFPLALGFGRRILTHLMNAGRWLRETLRRVWR